MNHAIVFDLDPAIFQLGPFQVRYYGIIFAAMLYIGFILWRRQMLRGGHLEAVAEKFLTWGFVAVLVGWCCLRSTRGRVGVRPGAGVGR